MSDITAGWDFMFGCALVIVIAAGVAIGAIGFALGVWLI